MRTRFFCVLFFTFSVVQLYAQKETSNWLFSDNQGFSFNTGNPVAISGIPSTYNSGTSTTTCSDAAGNILFSFSSATWKVHDRNYVAMPGAAIEKYNFGDILWAKYPGNPSKYYLFYSSQDSPDGYTMRYAVIDLSLNGGLGEVVISDAVIDSGISPAFTIIQKSGTEEFWVVNNKIHADTFYSRLVTAAGINGNRVKSRAGIHSVPDDYFFSSFTASPNGKMFAGAASNFYPGNFAYFLVFSEVFNFNDANGIVSNKVKTLSTMASFPPKMLFEFSPDNRLLYTMESSIVTGLQPCGFSGAGLSQYDLCYSDSFNFSRYRTTLQSEYIMCIARDFYGNVQTAPNKQLYMRTLHAAIANVKEPNTIGTHADFTVDALPIATGAGVTLPKFNHHEVEKATKNNIVYSGVCFPSPQTFSVTNDTLARIDWNFGDPASGAANLATTLSPQHAFSSPGIYTVTAEIYNHNNVLIETLTKKVQMKDPAVRLLYQFPADTTFCNGNVLKLKLDVNNGIFEWGYRVPWSGEYQFMQILDSIEINSSGTYIVKMKQNGCNGCEQIDSIHVEVLPVPYVDLGIDQTICAGDSVHIGVYDNDGNINCTWSTGQTTDSIWVNNAGQYWVSAQISNNGCAKRDTMNLLANPAVAFSLAADTILCAGQALLLNPGITAAQYVWQDNSTNQTFNVTAPGLYWVKVTKNGCFNTDSIHVNYVTADQVHLGNDTSVCVGQILLLQSGIAGDEFLWNTGATTAGIVVSTGGQYWIKVRKNGCWASDTINVTFNALPTFSLGNDQLLCDGSKVTLSSLPVTANQYLWQDNSTAATFQVSSPGLYWLELKKNGCVFRDSLNISYKPGPVLFLGNDTSICAGSTLLLNAAHVNSGSFIWQDGSTAPTFSGTSPGIYYVEATSVNGCKKSDTIHINEKAFPVFNLGNDTTICNSNSLVLKTGLSGVLHSWNTGAFASQITVGNSGIYWVDVTSNGCTKRDSILVRFETAPTLNLGKDTWLCNNATILLNAFDAGAHYLWQDGSQQPSFLVTSAGLYFVVVARNGCSVKDTINVSYRYTPSFSLGPDAEICEGDPIVLSPAGSTNDHYLWQDGSTSRSFTVRGPGLYILKSSNDCGTASDSVNIVKGYCKLFLPTAFTPNGDQLNDLFKANIGEAVADFNLQIFNKYGQVIFRTNDKNKGWNGRYKGEEQAAGTYVWLLSYKLTSSGQVVNTHGTVVLVR